MPEATRLSPLLIESGLATEAQITEARRLCEDTRRPFLAVILEVARVEDARVSGMLAEKLGVSLASRENGVLKAGDAGLKSIVPEYFARRKLLLPLASGPGFVDVAMADPTDAEAVEGLGRMTGLKVKVFVAARSEVIAAIDELYAGPPAGRIAEEAPAEDSRAPKTEKPEPSPGGIPTLDVAPPASSPADPARDAPPAPDKPA